MIANPYKILLASFCCPSAFILLGSTLESGCL